MRLERVDISGFAGVPDQLSLDLDADIVILMGANGFGKTSICDAIAWTLVGSHPRGADPRSLYSRSGETVVSLRVAEADHTWTVRRTVSNPNEEKLDRLKTSIVIEQENGRIRGDEATSWLTERLLPSPDARMAVAAEANTLLNAYYMQQESLREFLSTRSDNERFMALSRMVGAGSLSDLVGEFDSAKVAWNRAANKIETDIQPLRDRVRQLETARVALVADLESVNNAALTSRWKEWLMRVESLAGQFATAVDEMAGPSEDHLATARAALDARREVLDQLKRNVLVTLGEISRPLPPPPPQNELANLRTQQQLTQAALEPAEAELDTARRAYNATTAEVERSRSTRQELATLAQLALRHVSEECPTCGQGVDPAELVQRLQAMVEATSDEIEASRLAAASDRIQSAEHHLDEARTNATAASTALRRLLVDQDTYETLRSNRAALLRRVNMIVDDGPDDETSIAETRRLLERQLASSDAEILACGALVEDAATFDAALRIARSKSRITTTDRELDSARARLVASERDLTARRQTARVAEELLGALRADADNFLRSRLEDIQPLLSHMYSAIDPHPTFRSVQMTTRIWQGKPRLDPVVRDDSAGIDVTDPGRTLSTSQANALAVALFLAFNLGLRPALLDTLVLDDPLQSLDDVHLLGLVDLLRRVSPHRQMVITTHDASFASLLSRKLRPVSTGRRSVLARITQWDQRGPVVTVEEVLADPSPMKLVSATGTD